MGAVAELASSVAVIGVLEAVFLLWLLTRPNGAPRRLADDGERLGLRSRRRVI